MKGKLLKAFLVLCFCFVPASGVCASDSSSDVSTSPTSYNVESSKDITGRVIMSSYRTFAVGSNGMSQTTGYIKCDKDACVYGVRSSKTDKYKITLYSSGGNAYVYVTEYIHFDEDGSSTSIQPYNPAYLQSTVTSSGVSVGGVGSTSMYDHGVFSTKLFIGIPIFNSNDDNFKENVQKYIDSGDVSGAENSKDLVTDEIDGSIEVPHNLKISGEFSFGTIQKVFHDKLLSFGWSIPEMEGLTYDAQFKFNYLNKKMDSENGMDSDWYNWRDNIKYNYDSAAMILDVVNKVQGVNWLSSARTSLGLSMDDCYSVTFRVRNRKGDKVSNWVEIQLGQDGKATSRETDLNGNTQKSDEYNEDTNPSTNDTNPGSNDFYDWVKDNTDNSNNSDSSTSSNGLTSSIKDLKAFITSGFGLLGSNGIIALMSGLFSYIPASVWTLIKAAISMTILVMLIGLLKNLVFG